MTNFARYYLSLATVFAFVGCSSMNGSSISRFDSASSEDSNLKSVITPKNNVSQELVKQGVVYLRDGNYDDAQKVFSAAIKVNPNNSTIHLLNGLSYHLEYMNGSPDSKALAETAYGLANSLDKLDPLPLVQLGRLHMQSGEYSQASKDFVSAYALSPTDQDALSGLLQGSLLQKDFKTALWAGDKIKTLKITTSDNERLLVLMYSAVGKSEEASKHLALYAKLKGNDPSATDRLQRQVRFIQDQRIALESMKIDPSTKNQDLLPADIKSGSQQAKMIKVANNNPATAVGITRQQSNNNTTTTASSGSSRNLAADAAAVGLEQQQSSDSSSSAGSGTQPIAPLPANSGAGGSMPSAGGGGGTYSAVSMNKQNARWFDCDTKPGLGKAPGGSYGVPVGGTSGDQTLYLEPLPNPCSNNSPKMTSIDAVLIRTVDTQLSSYGINLLTGLQIFAGSQRSSTTTSVAGTSVTENVNASVLGIGNAATATLNGVSGLLNYTLNIANSTSNNTQVVARPTLTALDRIPSTFYSGGVQTVGLNGGGVSGAQVTNIPTGISLSVTPTFVDDETMMLAVKVSRSFIDGVDPVGGFNASLSVAQHSVTSNVRIKYGETLILDGLTLRTFTSQQNGVPVLQDIPIIQYLFNQSAKQQYVENIVVLITPRRMISNTNDLKKMEEDFAKKGETLTQQEKNVYSSMRSYQDLVQNLYPSIDGTLAALDLDSAYFRQFKMAVLSDNQDEWVTQSKMSKFLNDAANMAYFTR